MKTKSMKKVLICTLGGLAIAAVAIFIIFNNSSNYEAALALTENTEMPMDYSGNLEYVNFEESSFEEGDFEESNFEEGNHEEEPSETNANEAYATANQMDLTIEERVSGLRRMYLRVNSSFGLWDLMPQELDWSALYYVYEQKVIDATTTLEYYQILQSFLFHLNDGHSGIRFPPDLEVPMYTPGFFVQLIEGKIVVVDSDSAISDIIPGSVITKINQMDSMEYLNTYHSHLTNWQVPFTREAHLVYVFFNASPVNRVIDVEVITPDGQAYQKTLNFIETDGAIHVGAFLTQLNYANVNEELDFVGNTFWAQYHLDDILRIRVPHFADSGFERELREFLNEIPTPRAVVIDTRYHGGGNSGFGYQLLRHFIDASQLSHFGYYHFGLFSTSRPPSGSFERLNATSVGWYDIPVVILTNHFSGSAGENLLALARGGDRFTIMGTTTPGLTGRVAAFDLPGGGQFFISTQRVLTHDGLDISFNGITPDIWIEQTYQHWLEGVDAQLQAAIHYLREALNQ